MPQSHSQQGPRQNNPPCGLPRANHPSHYRLPNGDFSNSSIARARCAYAATISFAGLGSIASSDRISAVSSSNCDCHRLAFCFTTSPHIPFTVLTPIVYGNPHPTNTPPPATTTTNQQQPNPNFWARSTPPATGGGTATTQCPLTPWTPPGFPPHATS